MDPEVDHTEVRLNGPLVERLLLVESTVQDLKFARQCLVELQERLDEQPERRQLDDIGVIQTALWNAATIAYARCFVGGKRYHVTTAIVPADLRALHKGLMDLRGQHIAHFGRDSSYEHVRARADLRENEDNTVTINLHTEGIKTVGPTRGAIHEYIALVTTVLEAAKSMYGTTLDEIEKALAEVSGPRVLQASRRGTAVRLG